YIEKHAEIEDCNLLMQDYQKYKEKESKKAELVASSIRQMCAKGYYGVCFGMAQNRDINWNELLTTGEKFDREEINQTLSDEQHQAFDKVSKYLQIDRAKTESFNDLTKAFHQKAVICKEIFANLDKYKEALEFYQIATSKDKEKFNKHEIKALDRMTKYSDNYNRVLELVDNYKQADNKDKQELAKQLSDKPLTLIREGYLNSSDTLKDLKADIKNTLISGKLQDAIERDVHGADRVLEYVEAVYESRLMWSALSQLEFDSDTAKSIKKVASETNAVRNKAAYFLYMNQTSHKEALDIGSVRQNILEKHAGGHREEQITESLQDIDGMKKAYLSARKSYAHIFSTSKDVITVDVLCIVKENHAVGKALKGHSSEIDKLVERDTKWLEKAEQYALMKIPSDGNSFDKEQQKRITKALEIVNKSTSVIKDTPVDNYLRNREINFQQTSDVKYGMVYNSDVQKSLPAMVCVGRDNKGNIPCSQVIYLGKNDNGQYVQSPEIKQLVKLIKEGKIERPEYFLGKTKITRGVSKGAACLINKGEGKEIVICEGPETAMSLATVCPDLKIYSTFGSSNMRNFQLADEDKGKNVYICHDNDGEAKQEKDMKFLKEVGKEIAFQGSNVYLMIPPAMEGKDKVDINDMLTAKKTLNPYENIRKCFARAYLLEGAINHNSLTQEFITGSSTPALKPAKGEASDFNGLQPDDIYKKAYEMVESNTPKWQQEYFTVYQANRITQDIECIKRQYNQELSTKQVDEIMQRVEVEANVIAGQLEVTIKEKGKLTDDEMWEALIDIRDAATRVGWTFQSMTDNMRESIDVDSVMLEAMDMYLEQIDKEPYPKAGMYEPSPDRIGQLIDYHTNRFAQRYREEPSLQNKAEIAKIAELHDRQLGKNGFVYCDKNLQYMSYVHSESFTTMDLPGVDEMEKAPIAVKEISREIATMREHNMTRDDLNKVREALDVENLIDDVNIDDIKDKTLSKGKELEM
ncbi:MAG: toprim domain-containing protein, partial [Legionellales bacterium]|nr:toprim domain-containing protein [Legionellales bacterium]